MKHMPYERMSLSDGPDDDTPEKAPNRGAPAESGPSRTPNAAEGNDREERRMPQGEPGPTPGSAEGGALDEPSRH